jgi:hypothetical protein
MSAAKGTCTEMGVELIHKRGEGLRRISKRGPRENYVSFKPVK